jgi:hypothetical protein
LKSGSNLLLVSDIACYLSLKAMSPRYEGKPTAGIRRDYAAVINGLTLPHNSGAVEGHVNRIILWNQRLSI